MRVSRLLLATACAAALAVPSVATAEDASPSKVTEVVVTAQKLDRARAAIEPDLGSSTYTLPKQMIESLPAGDNVQLNQVVIQMPGVSQDSFGQLHVRDDHANIQFRINNVILPEGLNVFGQALNPRLADGVELITGALPAQYGLRTAGIINITTKSGFANETQVSMYGGSHGWIEPSFETAGASGNNNWFASGSYTQNGLGIESPDGSVNPHHDRTRQFQLFGFFDHIIDPQSRVSLIGGISDERFQIPQAVGNHSVDIGATTPNGDPLTVGGLGDFLSQNLNESQHEVTDYAIASYQHTTDRFTGQVSLFARYSMLDFTPGDETGEILFNGISQSAKKTDAAFGLQTEGVYRLNDHHTLRGGLILQADHSTSDTTSQVLLINNDPSSPNFGNQISGAPFAVIDNGSRDARSYSAYIEDEWKIGERLTVNYGVRFDQVDAIRNENQLSPRINAVWTPTQTTTVHAGYARYFTPPPFELIASETVSKFAAPTGSANVTSSAAPEVASDTKPFAERDNYYDLGVQQKIGGLTIGVDGYYRTALHLIDEGQFGAPIILTPFNYHDGRIQGVEFTGTYTRGPFSAYANFAIEKGQGRAIESSQFNFAADDLAYVATHFIYLDHDQHYTGSAGASYAFGANKVTADLIYGSGLRADDPVHNIPNGAELPAYTQVNASLQHKFALAGGPLDVRFDVINLFDERYEIRNGTGVGVGAPQWGPRRGFFVGLTKKFS
jgi:outer membrane receptor protein involved in Fe transport